MKQGARLTEKRHRLFCVCDVAVMDGVRKVGEAVINESNSKSNLSLLTKITSNLIFVFRKKVTRSLVYLANSLSIEFDTDLRVIDDGSLMMVTRDSQKAKDRRFCKGN
nr:hypothetical protein [Tanacetum cinerariifolium]